MRHTVKLHNFRLSPQRNMLKTLCKSAFRSLTNFNTVNLCAKRNAGHSKWQNIRHVKGAKDAERSALFAKISRQMKVAVQEGGSTDITSNLRLENVIEQAKRANMPQATIQSVLKSCETDKSNSKPHTFEIKGPGGCIILLEVFAGNLHQLKQNIATLLRKHMSKFSDGGASYVFEEKGIIIGELSGKQPAKNREEVLEVATDHAIESGAEDVSFIDDETSELQFVCGGTNLKKVTKNLEQLGYKIHSASNEFIPHKVQNLTEDELVLVSKLFEKLEALPEVVRISDNIA